MCGMAEGMRVEEHCLIGKATECIEKKETECVGRRKQSDLGRFGDGCRSA